MATGNLTGAAFSKYGGTSRVRQPNTLEQSARWRFADMRSNINALFRERRHEARHRVAVHTLYCVYVTSRRLNLHAARERAMKYSRRRHGRHATCARTMHRTGFGCCRVPFFDLPLFSPKGERKRTNFDFIMYRERARVIRVLLENKGNYMEFLPVFIWKWREKVNKDKFNE